MMMVKVSDAVVMEYAGDNVSGKIDVVVVAEYDGGDV